jgi:hypothetical protein
MTHINASYGAAPNRHRVGEPLVDLNFGLVEISWEASEVSLNACKEDGKVAFSYQVPITSRRP